MSNIKEQDVYNWIVNQLRRGLLCVGVKKMIHIETNYDEGQGTSRTYCRDVVSPALSDMFDSYELFQWTIRPLDERKFCRRCYARAAREMAKEAK